MAVLSRPAPTPSALPGGRWSPRAEDVVGVLAANLVIVVGMWLRHGGVGLLDSVGGVATGIGQLTALLGTYFALIQLLLMSRAPWLDRRFGRDRLAFAHRWLGFATVWLIVAHAVFTTVGFAMNASESVLGEAWLLIATWDYVLMATVSLGLFIAVAVTSVRLARRHLSYESWYGIHLYAYLAVALGFAHQLVVGTDFVDDPLARLYWVGLYVVTIGTLVAFRFGRPLLINLRHRFRVTNVVEEAPDVVSIYLGGHHLERLDARAGQYFTIRFLTAGWWRSHPYSLSAVPNADWVRVTIKDLGDDSGRARRLRIGTPAIVEGPYGNLTTANQTADRTLLIAGGIGITPLRAILEEQAGRLPVTLLYRVRHLRDLVFRTELDVLAERPGVRVLYQVGARREDAVAGALSSAALGRMIPDIDRHEVYICGPHGLMTAAATAAQAAGVPAGRIHQERFVDD